MPIIVESALKHGLADDDILHAYRIRQARQAGMSWATIGTFVGPSGEAARQRYGRRVA